MPPTPRQSPPRKRTHEDVAERGTLVIVRHGNPAQATYVLGVYAGRDKTTNPLRHVVESLDVIAGSYVVTHEIVGSDDIIIKGATQEQFAALKALRQAQVAEVEALRQRHADAIELLLNPPPGAPLTPDHPSHSPPIVRRKLLRRGPSP